MPLIIGIVLVIGCTLGGFAALGGNLFVLWQPFEVVIIVGSAIGAYIIGNPGAVLKGTTGALIATLRGSRYDKAGYLELLTLLYQILKVAKVEGPVKLEAHLERPTESELFKRYPKFLSDKTALTFLCDYLRLMTLGSENPHEMEALMDQEIESHHQEHAQVSGALQTMADGMPALGIVAAVLGVIKTMRAITEPPEVLGALIGGALVGTFLGVWLSYGFVGPIASKARQTHEAEAKYLQCIKVALLAHMNGANPAISVEFARKALLSEERPTFYEVEAAVQPQPAMT